MNYVEPIGLPSGCQRPATATSGATTARRRPASVAVEVACLAVGMAAVAINPATMGQGFYWG